MNDEEKKELQELINLLYNGHISQYGKRKLEAYIKKQQKEIEKLKQKEKEAYNFGYRNGCNDTSKFNDKTFIRIDKIKAKIEEIDFMIKEINQGHLQKYTVGELLSAKRFLQSLLKKE